MTTPPFRPVPERGCRLRGAACLALGAILGVMASCRADGGIHNAGDRMFVTRAFYGKPIVGRALFWIGEGDIPNYGASLQNYFFLWDQFAVGVGVDRIEFCPEGDKNFSGWEVEGRLRYYALETGDLGAFVDLNAGWLGAEHSMPEGGTRSNFTFSGGLGLDVPLGAGVFLLGGCEFHHWSNARGTGERATDNPAQNEYFPWLGLGIQW